MSVKKLDRLLSDDARELLRAVGRAAADRNERAYLVGGVVRDLLLGRPIEDIDVVIEGDVESLARMLCGPSLRVQRSHEGFGTVTLAGEGGLRLDLAAARRERYAAPGALPEVAAADLVQDLGRRDFTINAMAVALAPDGLGDVLDPFGGRRDLRDGAVRILHERSFVDDPTRAFRALRFCVRFGFDLERETRRRLRAMVRDGGMDRLSPARLRTELARSLGGPSPAAIVRALARHGVLCAVHPSLRTGTGVLARLRRYERLRVGGNWAVALGAVLWDASRPSREEVCRRLAPDRVVRRLLVEGPDAARSVCARLALPSARRASFVHRVCSPQPTEVLLLVASIAPRAVVSRRIERFLREWKGIRADIAGGDLLRAGVPAGPRIARGLAAALRAKLDGKAPDAPTQLRVALAAGKVSV